MFLRIFYALQIYIFFSIHLLPRNDTLYYRPMVEIVEYTYTRWSSIRGPTPRTEPRWGLGAKPPKAERFFLSHRVNVAFKRGKAATISGRFSVGEGEGTAAAWPPHLHERQPKEGGYSRPRPWIRHCTAHCRLGNFSVIRPMLCRGGQKRNWPIAWR